MRWSRCLLNLDDVISFGTTAPEALRRLEEVQEWLSTFGLQMKAKQCIFMQSGLSGTHSWSIRLACDPGKVLALRAWNVPDSVKQVRQLVGFTGYYRRFIQNFAGLLVALTQEGVACVWITEQVAFYTLNACMLQAAILGFPMVETLSGCFPCRLGSWRSAAPRFTGLVHSL